MPLVRVKTKFQITLPNHLREQAGIGVGDLLEAGYNGQCITLKPAEPLDKERVAAAIEEGLRDVEAGRVTPAFKNMAEFEAYLLAAEQ